MTFWIMMQRAFTTPAMMMTMILTTLTVRRSLRRQLAIIT